MTAANFKAVTRFQRLSGIPADAVQNDWHFHWDDTATDPTATEFAQVADALQRFYSAAGTGMTNAVGAYMSEALDRGPGYNLDIYKMPVTAGPLGAPVYTVNGWAFAASLGGTPAPEEVAICLSFRSAYGTDVEFGHPTRPRSSHRGRVYIGPLEYGSDVVEGSTTHEVNVNNLAMTDIAQAARLAFSVASPGLVFGSTHWSWQQWSTRHWLGRLVEECWVDNAFDTQRRRGAKPTARITKAIV